MDMYGTRRMGLQEKATRSQAGIAQQTAQAQSPQAGLNMMARDTAKGITTATTQLAHENNMKMEQLNLQRQQMWQNAQDRRQDQMMKQQAMYDDSAQNWAKMQMAERAYQDQYDMNQNKQWIDRDMADEALTQGQWNRENAEGFTNPMTMQEQYDRGNYYQGMVDAANGRNEAAGLAAMMRGQTGDTKMDAAGLKQWDTDFGNNMTELGKSPLQFFDPQWGMTTDRGDGTSAINPNGYALMKKARELSTDDSYRGSANFGDILNDSKILIDNPEMYKDLPIRQRIEAIGINGMTDLTAQANAALAYENKYSTRWSPSNPQEMPASAGTTSAPSAVLGPVAQASGNSNQASQKLASNLGDPNPETTRTSGVYPNAIGAALDGIVKTATPGESAGKRAEVNYKKSPDMDAQAAANAKIDPMAQQNEADRISNERLEQDIEDPRVKRLLASREQDGKLADAARDFSGKTAGLSETTKQNLINADKATANHKKETENSNKISSELDKNIAITRNKDEQLKTSLANPEDKLATELQKTLRDSAEPLGKVGLAAKQKALLLQISADTPGNGEATSKLLTNRNPSNQGYRFVEKNGKKTLSNVWDKNTKDPNGIKELAQQKLNLDRQEYYANVKDLTAYQNYLRPYYSEEEIDKYSRQFWDTRYPNMKEKNNPQPKKEEAKPATAAKDPTNQTSTKNGLKAEMPDIETGANKSQVANKTTEENDRIKAERQRIKEEEKHIPSRFKTDLPETEREKTDRKVRQKKLAKDWDDKVKRAKILLKNIYNGNDNGTLEDYEAHPDTWRQDREDRNRNIGPKWKMNPNA